LGPRACYNEGKRFAETLVMTYRDSAKLNTSIARIFNTYGPRMLQQSGRQVADFIKSAAEDKLVSVAGDENSILSFCYVKDAVEGLIALMASEVSDPINIGSAQAITLSEVATKVVESMSSDSKIEHTKKYAYTMQPAIPDISKAKEELNWFPLVSIEAGLKEAIEYYKATAYLHGPTMISQQE